MTEFYDLFFNLLIQNNMEFWSRMILIPVITLIVIWVVNLIMVRVAKIDFPFVIRVKFSWQISFLITILILNVYLFFLIILNGVFLFDWSRFEWSYNNIYVMLLPFALAYLIPVILFFVSQNQIKKQL